jgi:hypothetical protein
LQLSEKFYLALNDYLYLLERKYPEKTSMGMVSTRYALNHFERSILYRGVVRSVTAKKRAKRIITIEQCKNVTVHLDLFNVIFTIAAYLRGFPVYLAMDGLVRDASESHDSNGWFDHLNKALDLLLKDLNKFSISKAIIYLDSPLTLSSMLAGKIEEFSKKIKPEIKLIHDESPDHLIRKATEGVIATSDSVIIDKSNLAIIDLPRYIIENEFKKNLPEFLTQH